jgi:PAS domain S-box-containing protein
VIPYFINKKGKELLGYTAKDIIGKNFTDTFIVDEKKKSAKASLDLMFHETKQNNQVLR